MSSEDDRDNPKDDPKPYNPDWAADALRPVLERAARQQAEAEAHAAECADRPCKRCERFVCKCGQPVDHAEQCAACAAAADLASRLKPTRDSVPPHFRWALDADEALLRTRVRCSSAIVTRGLVAPPSSSLLMVGATGSGKTSLAVAMLDAWVRAEPRTRQGALFIEASWLSRARARYKLGADDAPLVTAAKSCPLLVLDDLGSEREDRDGCITDVVWARTNDDLPIWVTCGLDAGDAALSPVDTRLAIAESIGRRYDGGFARRVVDMAKLLRLGAK